MDEYLILLEKIQNYLKKDDVDLTFDKISLYDLHIMTLEKLNELNKITIGEEFTTKINKSQTFFNKIGRSLTRKRKLEGTCNGVHASTDGKISSIDFIFSKYNREWQNDDFYIIHVKRYVGSEEIFFGDRADRALVENFYDEINETFATLEDFYMLFNSPVGYYKSKSQTEKYKDELFDVSLLFNSEGEVEVRIDIKKEHDPEGIYNKEWYKREKISNYVKNHKDEIMKKIPVEISTLNPILKTIVEERINALNEPKQLLKK